jgi:hypothetical protein
MTAQLYLFASDDDRALARLLVAGDCLIAAEAVLRGYRALGPVIERELREQWLQWIDAEVHAHVAEAVRAWSRGESPAAHVEAAHARACVIDVRWMASCAHKTRLWSGEVGHA